MKWSEVRTLVVDDSSMMRSMLIKVIGDLGVTQIGEAADGLQAMEMIIKAHRADKPFHLILCDWNMPNVNGMQVLQKVRSTPELNGLAVVMVTTEGERDAVFTAISAGLDGFVLKPFDAAGLAKSIASALKKRSALAGQASQ